MAKNCENEIRNIPRVSVVIPVYAVENYIEQCAKSLFEQSLDSIEYIFVDDCSPDSSIKVLLKILEKYPSRKSQARVIRHNKNMGLAQARMTGFLAARGDYLVSIDSDDWVDTDAFKQLVENAYSINADIVIFDTTVHTECGDTAVWKNFIKDSSDYLSDIFCGRISPIIPTCIFKRYYIDNKLLSLPASDMAEDLVYSTELLYYAKKVSYLNKPFYHYRFNTQSITKQKGVPATIKRFMGIFQNTNQIINFLVDNGLQDRYSYEILHMKHVVKTIIWPVVGDLNAYRLWKTTYPEIVPVILQKKYFSFRTRLMYLMTITYLYPMYLKFRDRIRQNG